MPLPCLRTNRTQLPEWTIQYSWRYARHDQSNRAIRTQAVSIEWRYLRYESITYHTNYITYPPVPSVQKERLESLSSPKKCHLGIKVAESAIPHRIFLITIKNGIHADQRNRNGCSRHGASSMCSSIPWNWRRKKKREEEAIRRVQVKRRKQSEGLVEKKSPTEPQQDFAIRTGGTRYCQLQELLQNGPRYI